MTDRSETEFPSLREAATEAVHAASRHMPGLAMHRTEAQRLADAALSVLAAGGPPDVEPNVPLHLWTVFVPPIERCTNCRVRPDESTSRECPGPFDHTPPMSRDHLSRSGSRGGSDG